MLHEVWSGLTEAESCRRQTRPKWSKSTPTHLCAQYFMGQRWITKTCHQKISDCDWYLLHRVIRKPSCASKSFKPPPVWTAYFFSSGYAEESGVSVIRNHLCSHSKVMQWTPCRYFTAWWTFRLVVLSVTAASPARQNGSDRCTEPNTEYQNQRESDTTTPRKKGWKVFPFATLSMHYLSSKAAISQPWSERNPIQVQHSQKAI